MLEVKQGERGLRQSEAFFQHVNNLPLLLNTPEVKKIDAICVSTRPRSVEGSYMPVFKAGMCLAEALCHIAGVPLYECSHQENHVEGAFRSVPMKDSEFIAFHVSGGTTEVLKVCRANGYSIERLGGTLDISVGQLIDRIGVALGLPFPAGKYMDSLALGCREMQERIPSTVKGLDFNLSGQENNGLRYIKDGYTQEETAYITMMCVYKTLEKLIAHAFELYNLPVLVTGGVACSSFLKERLTRRFGETRLHFSQPQFAGDNAVGTAFIGYEKHINT
jgi:N6-L-threonylcarbamoyladenine synthase